jgi:uncharacterized protein (DUF1800 family)
MAQQGIVAKVRGARGAGRNGGGVASDPNFDLAPYVPSPQDPWDARKAAHLMRRAGFGARPEEIPAILALGVDRTVDLLLTPSTTQLQAYGSQVLPHGEVLDLTYDLPSQRGAWLYEMVTTSYPLKEKMVLFWHDHFSVGAEVGLNQGPLLIPHLNIFRRHGLGSFREMLIEVTKDPAMLYWLDNNVNGRLVNNVPTINENYGRELLELYTMGVHGGYTQQDVVQVSRCLTGLSTNGLNVYQYIPSWHITGTKTVLGKTVPSGTGETELAYLLDQVILPWPATAEYIVSKLWSFFVSETPYPALITELANRFRASNFNIRAVMSIILRSNYFYSNAGISGLVKNPVEYVVGAIRNLNVPMTNYRSLGLQVENMGWALLRYSNPSGLNDGVAWIDSQTLINRANFGNNLTMVTSGIGSRFDPTREIVLNNLQSAEAIVDHYLRILVGDNVPAAVRQNLYDFMHRIDAGYQPFNFSANKVSQKVRGLVHLILSLPEYSLN